MGGSDDDGGSGGASWVSDLDTGVKAEAWDDEMFKLLLKMVLVLQNGWEQKKQMNLKNKKNMNMMWNGKRMIHKNRQKECKIKDSKDETSNWCGTNCE